MYAALATTDFGLGLQPKRSDVAAQASDYLVAGSRIQVWISLTRLPWWTSLGGLLGAALAAYRKGQATIWAQKAKDILTGDVFTNVSATYSQGAGSISIMATTRVDFSHEDDAPGRVMEVLRDAGLDPVEEKWKIIQRGPTGKKQAPLLNAPNPDNTSGASGAAPDGKTSWDSFLTGAGISTPIVLAGAALLAVILLRR